MTLSRRRYALVHLYLRRRGREAVSGRPAPTVAAEDVPSPSPKRRRTSNPPRAVVQKLLEEVASVSEEGEVVAKVEGNMTCLPTACLNLVRDNDVKLGLESLIFFSVNLGSETHRMQLERGFKVLRDCNRAVRVPERMKN